MCNLLLSLFTKEQPWANCSCCSVKRATWVIRPCFKRIAFKNERFAQKNLFFFIFFLQFFTAFPLFMPKSESLPSLFAQSLFFKELQERFALVTLYKRATMRESLPTLFTKERPWAIGSFRSWQKRDRSDLFFFTGESLFRLQKSSDLLVKPMSEFPTLVWELSKSHYRYAPSVKIDWLLTNCTRVGNLLFGCLSELLIFCVERAICSWKRANRSCGSSVKSYGSKWPTFTLF